MVLFLFSHIVFSFFSLFILLQIEKENAFYTFILLFFIPIVGLLFCIITKILRSLKCSSRILQSYSDYVQTSYENTAPKKILFEKEINIIPMEEALLLNKNKIKRSLLMDILKKNPGSYINILKKSLEDSDTETSHYAATAITELTREFTLALQHFSMEYENNKTDILLLRPYANVLKKYLNSNLLDIEGQKKYLYLYSTILESILSVYTCDETYFIEKINTDIELGQYSLAKEYCSKFYMNHKENEETYLLYIKLFYTIGDYKNMRNTLNSLKNTSLKFSNRALNIVRFWSEGV